MRKINTEDVFKMARLMKNGNILQAVKNAYLEGRKEDADAQQIGIGTVMDIVCSCTDARVESQFYELLGGICEKKPEAIKTQSLEATVEDIRKIFQENNILNFLDSASSLGEMIQN